MAVVPMKPRRPIIENEATRRGRLASDTPGEFHYTSFDDYVDFMAGQVRSSGMNMAALARASDTIKSGSTVSHLAYGWNDNKGKHRRTRQPRFSTMFGLAGALGLEVIMRGRKKS
jgi:hypothetical protein